MESAVLCLAVLAISCVAGQSYKVAQTSATSGSNAFGMDLYQVMRQQTDENFVFSPLSASTALALIYLGAGGNTAQQLKKNLHLPEDASLIQKGYPALTAALQSTTNATVRIANKMFIKDGLRLKNNFKEIAHKDFRTQIEKLNFNDARDAVNVINQWISKATEGKIRNFFQRGDLDPDTLFVLINAIYFYGAWQDKFPYTFSKKFHLSSKHSVDVPTMLLNQDLLFTYLSEYRVNVLSLPYKDPSMKMLILLPADVDGLSDLEDNLPNIFIPKLMERLEVTEVTLQLPKFKIDSSLNLKDLLRKLGTTDLFSHEADLRNMADVRITVSQAVQKAIVEVSEEGTEATAASGFVGVPLSVGSTTYFLADHPFIFFIVGSGDTILFMGRVTNPSN